MHIYSKQSGKSKNRCSSGMFYPLEKHWRQSTGLFQSCQQWAASCRSQDQHKATVPQRCSVKSKPNRVTWAPGPHLQHCCL